MNRSINVSNLGNQSYTFALNACVESNSQDGKAYSIQNESSNLLAVNFPDGFKVIGRRKVIEQHRTIYALVNPETGQSQIGEVINCNYNDSKEDEDGSSFCDECETPGKTERAPLEERTQTPFCSYRTIVSSNCLNFNIDYPVKIRYKITDCGINIYFTDKLNQRRFLYFDYENGHFNDSLIIQDRFKVVTGYEDEPCTIPIYSNELDCNKINYHPDFTIPHIEFAEVVSGGNLQAGVYQFLIAYSDFFGSVLTSYSPSSNPIPIFSREITFDTDYRTNDAIALKIGGLDPSNIYGNYNLVVAETINNFTTFKLVGTFPVTQSSFTYTGLEQDLVKLSEQEVFAKGIYYKTAGNITDANNILFFSDLEEFSKPNLQRVANNINLYWKTVAVPETVYRDPKNTFNFREFQRDEVYPMGVVFFKHTGEELGPYHIPGPSKEKFLNNYGINVDFPVSNNDVIEDTSCNNITRNKTWQVYNTGKVIGTPHENSPECDTNSTWEWGEFAYWESIRTYPADDPDTWGDLCGKPIRFHKYPDSNVTHIHDGLNGTKTFFDSNIIYPIGLRVDHQSVINALSQAVTDGIILQEELDEIAGYRIVRGNRVGNKSIVAKGLLFDMWSYDKNGNKYYYPNYPYNDLRDDDFISNNPNTYQGGNNSNPIPNEFFPSKRYTFHSPDTHFNNPQIGTEIKLEAEEYGTSEGYFNYADEQAKYKFLSTFARTFAFAAGVAAAFSAEKEKECKTVTTRSLQQVSGALTAITTLPAIPGVSYTPLSVLDPAGAFLYSDTTGLPTSLGTIQDPMNPLAVVEATRTTCKGKTFQLLNIASLNPVSLFGMQLPYLAVIGLKEMQIIIDLIKAISPLKNFGIQYNSVGRYNNYKKVSNSGNKIREIERSAYLEPMIQLINEAVNASAGQFTNIYINNWNRERSVYLKTSVSKPAFPSTVTTDTSRFTLDAIGFDQDDLERRVYSPIASYYASIKNFIPDQYGNIDNVKYIETGSKLFKLDEVYSESEDGVYGGDTFITRVALKRKMPFFLQTRFRFNNESDVRYSELGNVGYPNYYFNVEEPLLERIGGNTFGGDLFSILTDILGVANTRLDAKKQKVFYQSGFIHLYNYGVPYFLAESDINTDFRHGENSKEKDFYPHQRDLDYWLQEKNVPITEDNYYFYNNTYSKQNKESFVGPQAYEILDCQTKYPFRVINSEESYNDNTFDNWLIFKPNNLYDAPASFGRIIGLDGIENSKVVLRFENTSQIFNAYDTLQLETTQVQVGNAGLFSSRPKEFASVELGYGGTQHSDMIKSEYGHIWVDAKRGQILKLSPNASGLEDIGGTMSSWFASNLPFQILKDFPDIDLRDIDNNFKGIGIALSLDKSFGRLILTKLDYKVLHCDVVYNKELKRFELNGEPIELCDTKYFCNRSWTASYNFALKSWVSFHSYTPNYYVDDIDYFESGINGRKSTLWTHNLTNKSYQVYYGKLHPFIIDTIADPQPNSQTLNSVEYDCDVFRYHNDYDTIYNRKVTFNKAIIYNDRQCSGLLELVPRNENNLYEQSLYPKVLDDKIQILVTNRDNKWRFNQFYDAVNSQVSNLPFFKYQCDNVNKDLNLRAFNYFKPDLDKQLIRSRQGHIRLINDKYSNYSFVFNFIERTNTPVK